MFRRNGLRQPWLTLCGLMLFWSPTPSAQNEIPEYNKLRTPSAPGFVLLGIEPTSVERPGSPTDLAFSVLSRTDRLAAVPENFALEVSPFWLFPHPDLTFEKYTHPGVEESMLHTATISLATSGQNAESAGDSLTSVAAGLRFSLLRGRISPLVDSLEAEIHALLQPWTDAAAQQINDELAADPSLAADSEWLERRGREINDSLKSVRLERLAETKRCLAPALNDRRGLVLEFAAAAMWDFPHRTWQESEQSRWGAWATPAMNFAPGSIVGVIRYLGDRKNKESNLVDVGVRVILVRERYAFSLESVGRFFTDESGSADQHRLALVADYKVSAKSWLTVTFGRDFDAAGANSLLALANLTLGFGEHRAADLPESQ